MRYRVAAISGALQEDSKITNIARKCSMLRTSLDIQIIDIRDIPLINVDMFNIQLPFSVKKIRDRIERCDGLIFVVPQFFGKVSPAFKNVYDWLSYSPNAEHPSPIRGMSACMISIGEEEGSIVQKHMLQISQFCKLRLMAKPSLHFHRQKLNSFGKNVQNSAGKDIDELQTFLEYFEQFLSKKTKLK